MSYDIYFVRSNELSAENVDEYLETEASDGDQHFITKGLMDEITSELAANGLSFETFKGQDDYIELNLETYQIAMSSSQIAILLPYWDANSEDAIGNEIEMVSKVLTKRGFTGYDPQTGELFHERKAFSKDFDLVNKKVKKHFSSEISNKTKGEAWRLIKLGLIFVLAVLLMRLLISVVGKVF